ncbi:MAG TPA: hypothetical protein VK789_09370 [Bryobacteraceae bacterium]|jgi:hypothetical protein|nr:hypothetical protein [Bryobacteraceae bacterium]
MKIIHILGTASGQPHPYDDMYLLQYDPTVRPDGMILLEVVSDPACAKRFADAGEALEEWRRSNGRLRPDGKPDRPLTAFTVDIIDAP